MNVHWPRPTRVTVSTSLCEVQCVSNTATRQSETTDFIFLLSQNFHNISRKTKFSYVQWARCSWRCYVPGRHPHERISSRHALQTNIHKYFEVVCTSCPRSVDFLHLIRRSVSPWHPDHSHWYALRIRSEAPVRCWCSQLQGKIAYFSFSIPTHDIKKSPSSTFPFNLLNSSVRNRSQQLQQLPTLYFCISVFRMFLTV
jgi:hypothetical protein